MKQRQKDERNVKLEFVCNSAEVTTNVGEGDAYPMDVGMFVCQTIGWIIPDAGISKIQTKNFVVQRFTNAG